MRSGPCVGRFQIILGRHDIQHNDIKDNDVQHNDVMIITTWQSDTHHNDFRLNDTRFNVKNCFSLGNCDIDFYNFRHRKVQNFEISNQFKRHRKFTVIFRR